MNKRASSLLVALGVVLAGCGALECRWHWKRCDKPAAPAEPTVPGPSGPCAVGLNDTVCLAALTEDSDWSRTTGAATLYWHFLPDQTWEQDLAVQVQIPLASQLIVEKRTGTLQLSAKGDVLTLTLTGSSCAGDSSFFKVFDATPQSLTVARSGTSLSLVLSPPMVVSAQGDYSSAVDKAVTHAEAAGLNAVFAPFSTAFWTDLATGGLAYRSDLATSRSATLAKGRVGCVSEAGIRKALGLP